MLASAEKLARIGADFLICPDNTIHQALPLIGTRSPLPWLHIADVAADQAVAPGSSAWASPARAGWWRARSIRRSSPRAGSSCLRPAAAERAEIDRIIMEELVKGVFTPAAVAGFQRGDREDEGGGLRRRAARLHRDPLIPTIAPLPLLRGAVTRCGGGGWSIPASRRVAAAASV